MNIKDKLNYFIKNLNDTSELISAVIEAGTYQKPQITLIFQNYDGKEYHLALEINETK